MIDIGDSAVRERVVPNGLTGLTVRGFKSLRDECHIEIRPLTILAGANSSGKSSIMQPLLLMKQTLEASYDPGPLLLNGPNAQFTSVSQFLTKTSGRGKVDSFVVKIDIGSDGTLSETFAMASTSTLAIEEMKISLEPNGKPVTLRPGMEAAAVTEVFQLMYKTVGSIPSSAIPRFVVRRIRCFLGFQQQFDLRPDLPPASLPSAFLPPVARCEEILRRSIHVPGVRHAPQRRYASASPSDGFLGIFDNYTASTIEKWQETRSEQAQNLASALGKLGLTWAVDARRISDGEVELHVGRLPKKGRGGKSDMVNIADVGFGVSQVLPVVVALLVAEPGQLVYLEQPELHLHPRAQVALAQVLADAAKRGVRVVAETHSSLLLLAIQTLVAEGRLPSDLVGLHWFERKGDGATKITYKELDSGGRFGDWPVDFGDVSFDLQSRYLDAAGKQRRAG